jgi:hypothetical protein
VQIKPFSESRLGVLVLCGSEGVLPDFDSAWKAIPLRNENKALIVLFSSQTPSLTFVQRVELVKQVLSALVGDCRTLDAKTVIDKTTSAAFDHASYVHLSIETVADFSEAYRAGAIRPSALAWRACLAAYLNGAVLIAGAGAAAALGSYAYRPQKPFARDLAHLKFDLLDGATLVNDAVILPYFEHTPALVTQNLCNLVPPHVFVIGIDRFSALVIAGDKSLCVGLGKVTILRDNQTIWVGAHGDAVPAGLISRRPVK